MRYIKTYEGLSNDLEYYIRCKNIDVIFNNKNTIKHLMINKNTIKYYDKLLDLCEEENIDIEYITINIDNTNGKINRLPDCIKIDFKGKIGYFPKDLSNLTKCEEIRIYDTNIIPTKFPDGIKQLYISRCGLTELPDVSNYNNLTNFYFYENKIEELPKLPDSIKRLHFGHNNIKDISYLKQLPNLEYVHCADNKITSIPDLNDEVDIKFYNNPLETLMPQKYFDEFVDEFDDYFSPDTPKYQWLYKYLQKIATFEFQDKYIEESSDKLEAVNNLIYQIQHYDIGTGEMIDPKIKEKYDWIFNMKGIGL